MIRATIALLTVVFMLTVMDCTRVPTVSVETPRAIAEKRIGKDIDEFPNATGQYILFAQKVTTGQWMKFIVIESKTSIEVASGSLMPGYVKWRDNDSLEVFNVPGNVKEGEDMSNYIRIIRIPQKP